MRLDLDNEPQPDLVLMRLPEKGGQARISDDDYIEGAPELAVETTSTLQANAGLTRPFGNRIFESMKPTELCTLRRNAKAA